jgi:hypothetical protein
MLMTHRELQMGDYRILACAGPALRAALDNGLDGRPSDDAPIPAPSGWAALPVQPVAPVVTALA